MITALNIINILWTLFKWLSSDVSTRKKIVYIQPWIECFLSRFFSDFSQEKYLRIIFFAISKVKELKCKTWIFCDVHWIICIAILWNIQFTTKKKHTPYFKEIQFKFIDSRWIFPSASHLILFYFSVWIIRMYSNSNKTSPKLQIVKFIFEFI